MFDSLAGLKRTHSCGVLRAQDEGTEVVLMGWVQRRRDHGGLVFVDLRDREGLTQVVFNPEINLDVHTKAGILRDEFVLAVRGLVNLRPPEMVNPQLDTGEIEVIVEELRILNSSRTPPFELEDFRVDISEALRLKYRYLDLRRPSIMKPILFRHRVAQVTRRYLNEQGFIEVETPILTKSTPEGARDYLVPSRVQQGHFYALPQSPQLFKQLLMMAGLDRYYQLCRCFRDEDLRADRQPEFTQIDMEMAFITEEDIFQVVEGLITTLLDETIGVQVDRPFPRLTFQECMDRFGLDRPDMRFGLELTEVSHIVKESDFRTFKEVVDQGGMVKALCAPGLARLSRKELDDLTDFAGVYGAKGLAWVKLVSNGWQSPLAKFFSDGVKIPSPSTWAPGKGTSFSSWRMPQRWPTPRWGNCGCTWANGRVWWRKTPSTWCGSPTSPCWNLISRKTAMRPCTTPSPRQWMMIFRFWKPSPPELGPGLTTWC